MDFLEGNNLLSNKQYGFLPGRSTQEALVDHINQITEAVESGKKMAAVYIDLKKAFDSIDHDVLLSKLENLGVCDFMYNWFRSYLTGRQQ